MNKKYCLKCGKPADVCPECKGKKTLRNIYESFDYRCPICNGTGNHKCKPEDLEEKSFEERWIEDEKEASNGS